MKRVLNLGTVADVGDRLEEMYMTASVLHASKLFSDDLSGVLLRIRIDCAAARSILFVDNRAAIEELERREAASGLSDSANPKP